MCKLSVVTVGALCLLFLFVTGAYGQETITLTVNSAYGSPDPPVGVHSYAKGTEITASVATPVAGGPGTRYACVGWKAKGSPQSVGHTNTVAFTISTNSVLTWKWRAQYLLTVNVAPEAHCVPGHVDVWSEDQETPTDGYWGYKRVAQLRAVENEGYDWVSWSGGSLAVRMDPTANPTAQQMRRPETITAVFVPEPRNFIVISARGEPSPAVGTYTRYYDETINANCGQNPYPAGEGAQYVCTGHDGTGDVSAGSETHISFYLHNDSSVTWLWQLQYVLIVDSPYGNPQGAGWYDEGVTASWSVTSPYPGDPGVQYVALDPTSGTEVMDAPKTVTITWRTQYYLTIDSAFGDPVGAGWYDEGTTASWSVTSPYPDVAGVQYVTQPAAGEVLIDAPKTVTVVWVTQYYLTTAVSPEGSGTITCDPAGPWYSGGTVVTLTATPNAGYAFTNWSGDLSGTTNPQTLTTDAPKSVTANFVPISFVKTWGGSSSDYASAVAVDSAGNIYCAGYTLSFGAGYFDALVLKYDSSGALQWAKTWGGGSDDRLSAVAVDSDENIYCAGYTDSFGAGYQDALLLKYDSSGMLQWAKTWGGSNSDWLYGVAVDSGGNIYCAGFTYLGAGGMHDALLLKYNSSGALQWARTWGGGAPDVLYSVAADSGGNIYCAGSTSSGVQADALLLKYDSSGTLQWAKTWGGSSDEWLNAVAIDSSGYIYCAGDTNSFGAGSYDALLLKYNSSGTLQWAKTWGGIYLDSPKAVAVDPGGNIYCGGWTNSFDAGDNHALLLKYNSSGALQCAKTGSGSSGDDYLYAVAVDSTGNVYLGGSTYSYTGIWQAQTGSQTSPTGSVSSPIGSPSSPSVTERSPAGTETSPTGSETGAGGADTLLLKNW